MGQANNQYDAFAACQEYTKREFEETEHLFRTKFERDRDRILYSKEFRRLSGKTQVFVAGFDDHIRTRLTHTLEVSQITRTICRALNLNEILGEAIAIGHDIGHTPFGHVGERTLNYVMSGCDNIKDMNNNIDNKQKGFKHNWQSLRVVMDLEDISNNYKGLNLTEYTLWGILNHSKIEYDICNKNTDNGKCSLRQRLINCNSDKNTLSLGFYDQYSERLSNNAWTIEALIVRQADEIAQRHHDIEDALEANIINKNDLINKIKECYGLWFDDKQKQDMENLYNEKDKNHYLSMLSRLIVNFLTTKLVENIKLILDGLIKEYSIKDHTDFNKNKNIIKRHIELRNYSMFKVFTFEEALKEKDKEFQNYLRDIILNSFVAQSMDGKASYILRQLIKAYISNPQQLPDKTIVTLYKNYLPRTVMDNYIGKDFKTIVGEFRNKLNNDHFNNLNDKYKEVLLRTICDYIAGMTDNYAMEQFNLLYGSKHL